MSVKLRKILSLVLTASLLFQQVGFAQIATELNIASHLSRMASNIMVERFRPAHLRYFSYDALNDNFKVLLDKGDQFTQNRGHFPLNLSGNTSKESVPWDDAKLQSETKTLLSYFLVGVTLPDSMFWVNLRPDSEDQIIDQYLEKTDIGKIMLEADLQLKKDTSAMTSPATPEGKEYWDKLYKKAAELFGYDNVSIPTLTRPWIVPGEIIVRESKESAYVYKANLKVMLEQDYLKDSTTYNFKDERSKALNEYSSELIRELIIPKLTREVNSSKRYAPLRQVYYSLILARWFKLRFKGKQTPTAGDTFRQGNGEATPRKVSPGYIALIDTKNLTNLISKESWSKTDYFNQYKESFADGEYNLKEQVYTPTGQTIRSYFSGGINVASSAINIQNGFTFAGEGISPKLLSSGVLMGGKSAEGMEVVSAASPIVNIGETIARVNEIIKSYNDSSVYFYMYRGLEAWKIRVNLIGIPGSVIRKLEKSLRGLGIDVSVLGEEAMRGLSISDSGKPDEKEWTKHQYKMVELLSEIGKELKKMQSSNAGAASPVHHETINLRGLDYVKLGKIDLEVLRSRFIEKVKELIADVNKGKETEFAGGQLRLGIVNENSYIIYFNAQTWVDIRPQGEEIGIGFRCKDGMELSIIGAVRRLVETSQEELLGESSFAKGASSAVEASPFSSTELLEFENDLGVTDFRKSGLHSGVYSLDNRMYALFVGFNADKGTTAIVFTSFGEARNRRLERFFDGDWFGSPYGNIMKELANIVKQEEAAASAKGGSLPAGQAGAYGGSSAVVTPPEKAGEIAKIMSHWYWDGFESKDVPMLTELALPVVEEYRTILNRDPTPFEVALLWLASVNQEIKTDIRTMARISAEKEKKASASSAVNAEIEANLRLKLPVELRSEADMNRIAPVVGILVKNGADIDKVIRVLLADYMSEKDFVGQKVARVRFFEMLDTIYRSESVPGGNIEDVQVGASSAVQMVDGNNSKARTELLKKYSSGNGSIFTAQELSDLLDQYEGVVGLVKIAQIIDQYDKPGIKITKAKQLITWTISIAYKALTQDRDELVAEYSSGAKNLFTPQELLDLLNRYEPMLGLKHIAQILQENYEPFSDDRDREYTRKLILAELREAYSDLVGDKKVAAASSAVRVPGSFKVEFNFDPSKQSASDVAKDLETLKKLLEKEGVGEIILTREWLRNVPTDGMLRADTVSRLKDIRNRSHTFKNFSYKDAELNSIFHWLCSLMPETGVRSGIDKFLLYQYLNEFKLKFHDIAFIFMPGTVNKIQNELNKTERVILHYINDSSAVQAVASSAVTDEVMEIFHQAKLALSENTLGYFAESLKLLFRDEVDRGIAAKVLISVYRNNSVDGFNQMILTLNNARELQETVKKIRDQEEKTVSSSPLQNKGNSFAAENRPGRENGTPLDRYNGARKDKLTMSEAARKSDISRKDALFFEKEFSSSASSLEQEKSASSAVASPISVLEDLKSSLNELNHQAYLAAVHLKDEIDGRKKAIQVTASVGFSTSQNPEQKQSISDGIKKALVDLDNEYKVRQSELDLGFDKTRKELQEQINNFWSQQPKGAASSAVEAGELRDAFWKEVTSIDLKSYPVLSNLLDKWYSDAARVKDLERLRISLLLLKPELMKNMRSLEQIIDSTKPQDNSWMKYHFPWGMRKGLTSAQLAEMRQKDWGRAEEHKLALSRKEALSIIVKSTDKWFERSSFGFDSSSLQNPEGASSAVESAPEKTGGIDFRALPMSIQPMGSFLGLNFKLPQLTQAQLKQINIESEIQQVKNLVEAGTVPSGDRIKELIAACTQKGEIGFYADNLLLCLVDICKLEEQNAFETSPELREALVIVDSLGGSA